MKRSCLIPVVVAAVTLSQGTAAVAQSVAEVMPKVLYVTRETVKPGRGQEHSRNESAFVAALEKANASILTLGLEALTGKPEVLYIAPFDSSAAVADAFKQQMGNQALMSEMGRLARVDGDYLNSVRSIVLAARPDLSAGDDVDLAKARFYSMTCYRVTVAKVSAFVEGAKAYTAAAKRAEMKVVYGMYSVVAGMPEPTYMVFTPLKDYAEFDQLAKDHAAIYKNMTDDERALFHKGGEAVIEMETNHFRVDPSQSYVSKEIRDTDPEFWSPK